MCRPPLTLLKLVNSMVVIPTASVSEYYCSWYCVARGSMGVVNTQVCFIQLHKILSFGLNTVRLKVRKIR